MIFDLPPAPKLWLPSRPAIVRAASLKEVEATFPFPILGARQSLVLPQWNPADKNAGVTLSNGNLTAAAAAANQAVRSVSSKSSGKWIIGFNVVTSGNVSIGLGTSSASLNTYVGGDANAYGYYGFDGSKQTGAASIAYGSSYTNGAQIDVAFDGDNNLIWWALNGTWVASGNPAAGTNAAYTGLTGTYFFMCGSASSGNNIVIQAPTAAIPSGFSIWS